MPFSIEGRYASRDAAHGQVLYGGIRIRGIRTE